MMSLNNSINNFSFPAIFDPSDPYENDPDKKKTCIKRAFWLQSQNRISMHEFQK